MRTGGGTGLVDSIDCVSVISGGEIEEDCESGLVIGSIGFSLGEMNSWCLFTLMDDQNSFNFAENC